MKVKIENVYSLILNSTLRYQCLRYQELTRDKRGRGFKTFGTLDESSFIML